MTGGGRLDRAGYPVLHLVRLVAALCIFSGHWCEPYVADAFPQGQLAIDLFFMVEGFLAARLLGTEPGSATAGAQLLARLRHVYPIYLAGLIGGFAAVASLALGHVDGWTPALWLRFLVAGAVLLPVDTVLVHGSVFPLNPPSWAIVLELAGFAALVLARRWSPRLGPWLLWLAGAALLLALVALWHDPNMGWRAERYWGGLPRMAFGFFGGALLASLQDRRRRRRALRGGWIMPLLVVVACVAMQFLRIWLIAWPLLMIATPLLVWTASALAVPRGLARLARWAGRHALAVYLLGYPIMIAWRLAGPMLGLSPGVAGSPAGFAIVLATLLLAAIGWVRAGGDHDPAPPRSHPTPTAMTAS